MMSSQRGNVKKCGPQKHQNVKAFKNDLHDKSKKMQNIKSMSLTGICQRCKDKIEWKIKYRKYKPLTVKKKCVGCGEKAIKQAYYTLCTPCATKRGVCAKCAQKCEIVFTSSLSPTEQAISDSQLKRELEMLPERKRRTFFRLQAQGKLCDLRSEDNDDDDSDASHSDNSEHSDVENLCEGSPDVRTDSTHSRSDRHTHTGDHDHIHSQQNRDTNIDDENSSETEDSSTLG